MKVPTWLKMTLILFGRERVATWLQNTLLHVPDEEIVNEALEANVSVTLWRRVEKQQAERVARLLIK